MRFLAPLLALGALLPAALAADSAHWTAEAAKSKDGVIKLDTASYDAILAGDRDFGLTVILTALPASYKCEPCHKFDPVFRAVADSWRRVKKDQRDKHLFAQLDFPDGQPIYQRLGLSTAPTVYYHPPTAGPRKSSEGMMNYDLNRAGLGLPNLHTWVRTTTPVHFELYKPIDPLPFILVPLALALAGFSLYTYRGIVIPIVQSRFVWGSACVLGSVVFTSGYMWNRIKNAPYVQADRNGKINWIAGGYSNQLGLESQVIAALYFLLALSVIVLTVFIPAQSSPSKQRLGVYLWLAMITILFSIIIRLFKIKNGGYPFHLL